LDSTITAVRSSDQQFVDTLGNWTADGGPLQEKLAAAIQAAIERGELRPGTPLPAERQLARSLFVSRTTVVGAYRSLKARGWLESRQGSGTWVRLPETAAEATIDPIVALRGVFRAGGRDLIDLTRAEFAGTPLIACVLAEIAGGDVEALLADSLYDHPLGLEALREAVAARLRETGLEASPEQILITTGDQQALMLIASLLLRPGEAAVVENPTSLGALDALRSVGARLVGVEVGRGGLEIEARAAATAAAAPRLIYLLSTHHTPTGTTIGAPERRRIARLSTEAGLPVVDDMTHAWLGRAEPPAPLAAYGGQTLTIGSMSKLFWSGLRVGWIHADAELIGRLGRLKAVNDLGTPLISQLLSARLLARQAEVVAQRRQQLEERLAALVSALRDALPEWSFTEPSGGLVLWLRLPAGDADQFAQVALRHGVVVLPGPLNSPTNGWNDHLRLAFNLPPDELREGVARLAEAWRSFRARPGSRQHSG